MSAATWALWSRSTPSVASPGRSSPGLSWCRCWGSCARSRALAIAAAAVGIFAVMRGPAARRARWATLAIGLAAVLGAVLTPPDRLASLLPGARGGTLVFYEESLGGTVAVVEQQTGQNRFRRLYIQGVSNSGDAMPSLRYMRLQALLPLIIHGGEPRSALVIGLGTGITAGCAAALSRAGAACRAWSCCRRSSARRRCSRGTSARRRTRGSTSASRDGRRELLQNPARYDLITLEPPPPSAAGVVNLYSSDFYALAGTRLRQDGLLAQWWPLPTQNDEDSRSLVRSFLDAFPHASLWTTELHEMLLIGSFAARSNSICPASPHVSISPRSRRLCARSGSPPRPRYWRPGSRTGPASSAMSDGAPPVTDDRPRIEYATWVRPKEFGRVLPRLLALRTMPPFAVPTRRS